MSNENMTLGRFQTALREMDALFPDDRLDDSNVDADLHRWLDGDDPPLAWASPSTVTPDEWFFITTLYGQMTAGEQRMHIRKHFPELLVSKAGRDIRNLRADFLQRAGLHSSWMIWRLVKMANILRRRNQSMTEYTSHLKELDRSATTQNPAPALDEIIRDHHAGTWKTLSVFIRDCVRGNCFPIDSRVQKELLRYGLPNNEHEVVSLCLQLGRNPRRVARMFYQAIEFRK